MNAMKENEMMVYTVEDIRKMLSIGRRQDTVNSFAQIKF